MLVFLLIIGIIFSLTVKSFSLSGENKNVSTLVGILFGILAIAVATADMTGFLSFIELAGILIFTSAIYTFWGVFEVMSFVAVALGWLGDHEGDRR